jgi:hypothetical protein
VPNSPSFAHRKLFGQIGIGIERVNRIVIPRFFLMRHKSFFSFPRKALCIREKKHADNGMGKAYHAKKEIIKRVKRCRRARFSYTIRKCQSGFPSHEEILF